MSTPDSSTASCSRFYGAQHARGAQPPPSSTNCATALELCTRVVVTADEAMMVADAARRMRDQDVGALVVIQEPSPTRQLVTGMLTDRDITTRAVAPEHDSHALRVGDIMSRDPITARPADTAVDLLTVMKHRRVRRIPVVGPEAELIGIVTLDDLLAALATQVQGLAGAVRSAQRREI